MTTDRHDESRVYVVVCGADALVAVTGEIDLSNEDLLAAALDEAIAADVDTVVELADMRFIGLGGLRMIAAAAAELAHRGRRLRVTNARPMVAKMFRLVHEDHLLAA